MDCGIPFCHNGCPLGNLIPEWNDLVWRDDWDEAHRAAARDQQLPGVHRPAVPGAVRDRLRARHQPATPVTIKNVEVSIIDQAWDDRRVTPAAARVAHRQDRRRRRLRPGRSRRRPAADPRRPHRRGLRARRPPGGLLRYGIPEFKMEKTHLDRRIEQMQREGTIFRYGRRGRRRRSTGPQLRERYDAVVLAIGATVAPRPAGAGPRARRHPPGDGVPAAGQPRRAGRRGRGPDHAPRASTSSSSAAATPARTASARRTARAPGRSPSWRSCRSPPEDRPDDQPWPTYPMIYRVSSAHEEGGERVYSVSTTEFLGDGRQASRALRLVEVEFDRRQVRRRSRAPSGRSRPSWCCSPWASPARSRRAWSTSSASSSTSAATSRATTTTCRASTASSSPATPAAASR